MTFERNEEQYPDISDTIYSVNAQLSDISDICNIIIRELHRKNAPTILQILALEEIKRRNERIKQIIEQELDRK